MQNQPIAPQTVQVPNYSGVNIQIFNPAVNTPGTNVVQQPCVVQNIPQSYPQDYYIKNYGQQPPTANATATATVNAPAAPVTSPIAPTDSTQTINTNNTTTNVTKKEPETEKREIVLLTDDYIRNLESYLNNKDAEIRLMAAKEVLARLQEDSSRKGDLALNALVNKMLQDPSAPIKFIAMSALSSGIASGDNLSIKLLQEIQKSQTGYGEDAKMASDILLKISGQRAEKEFEVKKKPKGN